MLYTLNDFSSDLNFTVVTIDIDEAAIDEARDSNHNGKLGLKQQYNDLVPVLKLGDEEICHHFFDRQALIQTLGAERTPS